MFRTIARLGHLLTFEHNVWYTHKIVSVPVYLVTLQMINRTVLVSTTDNAWRSDHDTDEEAIKVYFEFLACIHPSPFNTQSVSHPLDFSAMSKVADASKDLPKLQ